MGNQLAVLPDNVRKCCTAPVRVRETDEIIVCNACGARVKTELVFECKTCNETHPKDHFVALPEKRDGGRLDWVRCGTTADAEPFELYAQPKSARVVRLT
jgi:hypothetical protein